ncbi:PQQ-binding-like beta-propeller repeat protein [Halobacterium wangiae]|uniref:outer membrane protein assembly factor BamB family protein n=1 Tax=Halobacterium wangiae TaxID=2902623 RepID=UPI001E3450B6|nr:PQQ-binding-like beta-propeller repeat protein [Halobacterium wangiae]
MRRRALLQSLGTAAALATTGLAGCMGSSDAQTSVFDREAPAPTGVGTGWQSPRLDARNSARAGVPGPGNAPGVAWQGTVENARFRHEPMAFGDTVLVPSVRESRLLAFDARDGSVRWERDLESASGPVTVHDGTVLCPDGHRLQAFREESQQWVEPFAGEVTGVTAVDGTAYVATADGSPALYALAVDDGSVDWQRETGLLEAPPAVADGQVIVGDMSGLVRAFDVETGEDRWQHAVRDDWLQASVVVAGDTVYAASGTRELERGHVYALGLDGDEYWERELGSSVMASPAVGSDRLFVVDAAGTLHALDAAGGSTQWEFTTGDDGTASLVGGQRRYSPAVCNGLVYYVGADQQLRAIETDAERPDVRWSATHDFTTAPVVAGQHLFVGARDELVVLGRPASS